MPPLQQKTRNLSFEEEKNRGFIILLGREIWHIWQPMWCYQGSVLRFSLCFLNICPLGFYFEIPCFCLGIGQALGATLVWADLGKVLYVLGQALDDFVKVPNGLGKVSDYLKREVSWCWEGVRRSWEGVRWSQEVVIWSRESVIWSQEVVRWSGEEVR